MNELVNIEEMLQTLESQDAAITNLKSELSERMKELESYKEQIESQKLEKSELLRQIQTISSEKSKLKSKVRELADRIIKMNQAASILKENENLIKQNSELKSEMMAMVKETDEKRKQLDDEYKLLNNEKRCLLMQRENLEELIEGRAEMKVSNKAAQFKRIYEKRWTIKQHYLKGLLAYGISVTVLEAVRSKIFVQDVGAFFRMIVNVFLFLIRKDFQLAVAVANVSENISGHMAERIMYWIIVCLICGISIVSVGLILKFISVKVMDYYSNNPPDYITVTTMMISMAVMVFLGKPIKRVVPVNLLLLLFVIHALIGIIKNYVKGWKRARGLL